jgi:hypothetical protein
VEEDPDLFVKIHCGPLPDVRASKQSFREISYPEWRPDRRHNEGVTKRTASRHPRPTTHDHLALVVYLPVLRHRSTTITLDTRCHAPNVGRIPLLFRTDQITSPFSTTPTARFDRANGPSSWRGIGSNLNSVVWGAELYAWVRCPYEHLLIFDTSLRVL